MMIRILVLISVAWIHAYVLGSQHMHCTSDVPVVFADVMVEVDPETVQGDDQRIQQRAAHDPVHAQPEHQCEQQRADAVAPQAAQDHGLAAPAVADAAPGAAGHEEHQRGHRDHDADLDFRETDLAPQRGQYREHHALAHAVGEHARVGRALARELPQAHVHRQSRRPGLDSSGTGATSSCDTSGAGESRWNMAR